MRVGLIDVDSKMPNLALMKISAYHKARGDSVEWFDPLFSKCDKVYASKIFTFTKDYEYMPPDTIKGGTGYGLNGMTLAVSAICPDYGLYDMDYSVGFLTRGCPNKCEWCIVPDKEGDIRPDADISDFLRHDKAVLLDNNVLAHEHGTRQIEKIAKLGIKVDFNQGLDARLIDMPMARLLAKVKWLKPVRLACDTEGSMKYVHQAVAHMRLASVTPKAYFCYMLVKDVDEAHRRAEFLRGLGVDPFAQPYRDFNNNTEPTQKQKDFARWVNHKAVFKTVKWEDYR